MNKVSFTFGFIGVVTLVLTQTANAEYVRGVCDGRALPSEQSRQVSDVRLECSSEVSNYVRASQSWDYKSWRDAEAKGDRALMQAIAQKIPLIEWSGEVPYQTIERWNWVEWYHGPSTSCNDHEGMPAPGGYHTEYHMEDREECTARDKDGKCTSVRRYQERVGVQVINVCWHDEPRTAERPCSWESMSFNARFHRPNTREWGPHVGGEPIKKYWDVIPNKYDLLPGEVEVVQLFSNRAMSRSITPSADVGDAWNAYSWALRLNGGASSARCLKDQKLHLDATVFTNYRILKKTPNAFRIPKDPATGRETPAVKFDESVDARGKEYIQSIPVRIELQDASNEIVAAMARQSRDFTAKIDRARDQAGQLRSGGTEAQSRKEQDAVNNAAKSDGGFWRDTQVRIRFWQDVWGAPDINVAPNAYLSGSDVEFKGGYSIDLKEGLIDIYKRSAPFKRTGGALHLIPGTKYRFLVSMYQKGMPFYTQAESRSGFFERFQGEDRYYSSELRLDFGVNAKAQDERPVLERFKDWLHKPFWSKARGLWPF